MRQPSHQLNLVIYYNVLQFCARLLKSFDTSVISLSDDNCCDDDSYDSCALSFVCSDVFNEHVIFTFIYKKRLLFN